METVRAPKISIIVPVYNAEAYLRKCLDSITAQTHQNLEVILVDDGSPDSCPAICDEYAANDFRFKTIHKKNGGPGSAYNAGLNAATGDWIGFVDNDDWVEPDMFEYLLAGALRHGVKAAACGYCNTDGQREKAHTFEQERVISGRFAVEMLLDGRSSLRIAPWQRLYARELWDGIRFAETENTPPDFLAVFAVLMRMQALVCLPDVKYHWRVSQGSYSSNKSLHYQIESYLAWEQLYNELFAQEPELQAKAVNGIALAAWGVWSAAVTTPRDERKAALSQLQEISAFCRPLAGQLAENGTVGPLGRIAFRLLVWPAWWSFAIAYVLRRISDWKHGAAL